MRLSQLPLIAVAATTAAAKSTTERVAPSPVLEYCNELTHQAKGLHDFLDLKPLSQLGQSEIDHVATRGTLLANGLEKYRMARSLQLYLESLKNGFAVSTSPNNEKKILFPQKSPDVCNPKENLDDCEAALTYSVHRLGPKFIAVSNVEAQAQAKAKAQVAYEHSLLGRLNRLKQQIVQLMPTLGIRTPGTGAGEKLVLSFEKDAEQKRPHSVAEGTAEGTKAAVY